MLCGNVFLAPCQTDACVLKTPKFQFQQSVVVCFTKPALCFEEKNRPGLQTSVSKCKNLAVLARDAKGNANVLAFSLQVHAVAPPPIRVTNFFISEILKPHFGGQKDEPSPPSREPSPRSSPMRPEADRSPSISPAKSENTNLTTRTDSQKNTELKKPSPESGSEKRAFQIVKRKRNKSEEERNSDICKLSIRDDAEAVELGSSRLPGRQFVPGLPQGIPQGFPGTAPPLAVPGPPGPGAPLHPSLQAHLYPQLINSRYYQQYHPYYQLYYQQYQQLQLQRQQQLYNALQQQNNRRLDPKSGLSLDMHHTVEGLYSLGLNTDTTNSLRAQG